MHARLPAASFEYFGETATGNTAFPALTGDAFFGAAALDGFVLEEVPALAPHSALRKSFHFIPCSVSAFCAASYLALHSFIDNAYAGGTPPKAAIPTPAITEITLQRSILSDPLVAAD
jgi:hypothetical protein